VDSACEAISDRGIGLNVGLGFVSAEENCCAPATAPLKPKQKAMTEPMRIVAAREQSLIPVTSTSLMRKSQGLASVCHLISRSHWESDEELIWHPTYDSDTLSARECRAGGNRLFWCYR